MKISQRQIKNAARAALSRLRRSSAKNGCGKLRKSLSVLSEPERVVIKLLYKDELTPEQAARKLGVTSSTIRSHKKNALDKLKKEMLEDD